MAVLRDLHTYHRTVLICMITTLGAITSGYDLSYFSGILVLPPFVRAYGKYNATTDTYILPSWLLSLITSTINLGEVVGAIVSHPINMKFGRRGGIYIACGIFLLGILFQAVAPIVALLVIGRFFLGMGIAIVAASVPLYIADCAPACLRGSLVAAYQFSVGIGLIFGTATVFGTNGRKGSGSYLIPMTVQAILPLCLIIACLIMVPESPRWLAEKGQLEEARKSLRQLAGKPDINVDGDLDLIIAGIEQQRNNSWKGLLSGPEARKLMLGIGMAGWSQASGINFIVSYGAVILTSIGSVNPYVVNFALYSTALPIIMTAQYLLERVGRRKMLMLSMIGIALINIIDGGLGISEKSTSVNNGAVALYFLFYIAFNLGLGTTIWVSFAELSVGRNRSRLISVSTACVWLFSWLVSFTFPYLYNPDSANLGPKIGFIYGALMFIGATWVYFLLPETAGRSLEEIDEMFALKLPARRFANFDGSSQLDAERTGFEAEGKSDEVVTFEMIA